MIFRASEVSADEYNYDPSTNMDSELLIIFIPLMPCSGQTRDFEKEGFLCYNGGG